MTVESLGRTGYELSALLHLLQADLDTDKLTQTIASLKILLKIFIQISLSNKHLKKARNMRQVLESE